VKSSFERLNERKREKKKRVAQLLQHSLMREARGGKGEHI
jgi:hypothetical protein